MILFRIIIFHDLTHVDVVVCKLGELLRHLCDLHDFEACFCEHHYVYVYLHPFLIASRTFYIIV